MYKIASQKKLRIATNRGNLSVEQLWDLSKDEIGELAVALPGDRSLAYQKEVNKLKGIQQ